MEDSIITRGNKILHITRRGILRGIYMRVDTMRVIYTAQRFSMEASFTIHENDFTNMTSHNKVSLVSAY